MDFQRHFAGPAVLAGQLKSRWFPTCSTNPMNNQLRHRMPILRRNLSYARAEKPRKLDRKNSTNAKLPPVDMKNGTKAAFECTDMIAIICNGVKNYEKQFHSLLNVMDGDAAPHYDPKTNGPPIESNSAFILFCESHRSKEQSVTSSSERLDKEKESKHLMALWDKLYITERRIWRKRAKWDKTRYEEQINVYRNVAFRTSANSPSRAAKPQKSTDDKNKTVGLPKTYFHYVYMDNSNFPVVQVEMKRGWICPLCSHRAHTGSGLVIHCKAFHAGLSFDAAKDEEGNLHVAVRSEPDCDELSFSKECKKPFYHVKSKRQKNVEVPFVKRPFETVLKLDLPTRKKKIRILQMNGGNADNISRFVPGVQVPIRQYYHSRTNMPILAGEWDQDSDDEYSNEWILRDSEELINEFEDVSNKEKVFMKLWNRFIHSHATIPDSSIPGRCMNFIEMHSQEIMQSGLRQNLLLHLFNLWDFSLVSSSHILSCMESFDAISCSSHHHGNGNELSSNGGKERYTEGLQNSLTTNTSSMMNSTNHIELPHNVSGGEFSSNARKKRFLEGLDNVVTTNASSVINSKNHIEIPYNGSGSEFPSNAGKKRFIEGLDNFVTTNTSSVMNSSTCIELNCKMIATKTPTKCDSDIKKLEIN